MWLHSCSLALPVSILLGWKWLTVENTLVYYATELITVVNSFMVQAQGVTKLFSSLLMLCPKKPKCLSLGSLLG